MLARQVGAARVVAPGCQTQRPAPDLADAGLSYARMRRQFERSGDLRTVVRLLADETGANTPSNLRS